MRFQPQRRRNTLPGSPNTVSTTTPMLQYHHGTRAAADCQGCLAEEREYTPPEGSIRKEIDKAIAISMAVPDTQTRPWPIRVRGVDACRRD